MEDEDWINAKRELEVTARRYFKNEDFSTESLSLIELRIKGKYNHVKKSSFKSEDLYKHYKNFLSNIKKSKKDFNSIEK